MGFTQLTFQRSIVKNFADGIVRRKTAVVVRMTVIHGRSDISRDIQLFLADHTASVHVFRCFIKQNIGFLLRTYNDKLHISNAVLTQNPDIISIDKKCFNRIAD
ncbi:hypothetical protein SDC9_206091 [bioreactor metagenome]|uniref:Uncharacterized protein n=1 Tax=bioreactor metagenome TaxID=1076179 RepID=A0A645J4L3_9ZZZZ